MCIQADCDRSGRAWFRLLMCRNNENSQLGREYSVHFHPAEQGGGRGGIKCGACGGSEWRKISSDGCKIFAWLLWHAVARKLDDKDLERYFCLHYIVMLSSRRFAESAFHHICILPNVIHVKICALVKYSFAMNVGRKIFVISWSLKMSGRANIKTHFLAIQFSFHSKCMVVPRTECFAPFTVTFQTGYF